MVIWFEERTRKERSGDLDDHQEGGLVEEDESLKESRSDKTSCDEMLILVQTRKDVTNVVVIAMRSRFGATIVCFMA